VLEVHHIDAGDHGRHDGDGDPRGDPPPVLVLADARLCQVRLEDAREQISKALALLVDAKQVVIDVSEVFANVGRNERNGLRGELVQWAQELSGSPPELEDLPLQIVDTLHGILALRREHGKDPCKTFFRNDIETRRVVVVQWPIS
jgi:hypothetical protein